MENVSPMEPMSFDELPELATRTEAARFLRVSVSTIDRLRRDGELEAVLVRAVVRIPRDALRDYQERVTRTRARDDEASAL